MTVLKTGLIGEHISRTRLPAALQILCDAHGMKLEFELIDTAKITGFDFEKSVDEKRMQGWDGVAVTHPFKTRAAGYAGARMSADVSHLGASNLLVFRDPLVGLNTDYTGFLAAFAQISDRGPVAMVGAGGVARSIAAALLREGVSDLAIYDMDGARAADLACGLGPPARAIPEEDLREAVRAASGVVNATPLGMVEYPGSAFNRDDLGAQVWAFDAVYTPTNTRFLQDAAAAGLQCLTGFDLFRHMAIRSFAGFTGISLDAKEFLPRLEGVRP